MPVYTYHGETDTLHPKLGLLKPGVPIEIPDDLVEAADAMDDLTRGADRASAKTPYRAPAKPTAEKTEHKADENEEPAKDPAS